MALKINLNYSPNFNPIKRKPSQVKFLIFHYTGMKKESSAIKKLTKIQSEVSSHYFIKNNGDIILMVPDLYIAWHAGQSSWKNYKSLNKNSIGIEINNPGHQYNYKKYSTKQISSILKLGKYLIKKYNIKKKNILGHSDIAPNRKKDPGEKFPWKDLAKIKLTKWHNLDEKKIRKFRLVKLTFNEENKFLKNLLKIGYNLPRVSKLRSEKKMIFKAFQRRFRQSLINGFADQECLLISKNLLK